MPTSKTFKGKKFPYEGSIDGDFLLCFSSPKPTKVKKAVIGLIKKEISNRGTIKAGLSRTNPPANSLGAFLMQNGKSASLSHILPLLEEAGFITHWWGNGVWVKKKD
ncbi:MAG: hypothetical protein ACE5DW_07120 [Thermodesulfobacteriota bacterium]